ncbi:hypothetical protein GF420_12905 [candidate division GN15 bacterium]|nr:hypothetical protein [candidate division GN15 bacterium]
MKEFKPRYSLLPWGTAMRSLAFAAEHGAGKHGEHDYQGKTDPVEFIDKAVRHIDAFLAGRAIEPGTNKHHLAAATMDLLIALHVDLSHRTQDAKDN